MKTFKIWTGTSWRGDVEDDNEAVCFEGEELGVCEISANASKVVYSVYKTKEGILIHEYEWKKGADERRRGIVYEFATLEDAAREFGYILQLSGVEVSA